MWWILLEAVKTEERGLIPINKIPLAYNSLAIVEERRGADFPHEM